MSSLAAQVSLYPLRKVELEAEIDEVIRIFHRHGLEAKTGPMSTLLLGEADAIFAALREALDYATAQGDMVMVVAFTNAAPDVEDAVQVEVSRSKDVEALSDTARSLGKSMSKAEMLAIAHEDRALEITGSE